MSTLSSIFIGVPQSRYAALAILLAMIFVSISILLGKSPMPMSQKFGFVVLIFIISLPSLAMSLFQLTCIVTGAGIKNQRWWCSLYATILSAVMIFYAALVVISAIMALAVPPAPEHEAPVDMNQANKVVEKFFLNQKAGNGEKNPFEMFTDAPSADDKEKKEEEGPAQIELPPAPPVVASPSPENFADLDEIKKLVNPNTFLVRGGASLPAPATFQVQGGASIPAPYGMEKFSDMMPLPNKAPSKLANSGSLTEGFYGAGRTPARPPMMK